MKVQNKVENNFSVVENKDSVLSYKVVKSSKLINSISDFNAIQHRIILCAIAQIKPKDKKLTIYTVYASDIVIHNNYSPIRKAVEKLPHIMIGIKEGDDYIDYPFVECITFVKDKGRCVINVIFSKKVEAFLIGIHLSYTAYTLKNVIKFTCNYSLRIYELCKQYIKKGHNDFTIVFLRLILNLNDKHLTYSHFKNRVLLPSFAEINKYSDIKLSYKEFINCKSVYKIKIFISFKFNQMIYADEFLQQLNAVANSKTV